MHLFPHRRFIRIAKTLLNVKRVFRSNVEILQKSLCSPPKLRFRRCGRLRGRLRGRMHGGREGIGLLQQVLRPSQKRLPGGRERDGVPLLAREGVTLRDAQHVDLRRYQWQCE